MQINISAGEALDRLSILEIKEKNITDHVKLTHIKNEKSEYVTVAPLQRTYSLLYQLLVLVNTHIWDATNNIKNIHPSDNVYASIASSIFEWNQHRFRLKNHINYLTSAKTQEQKSYPTQSITIGYKKGDSIVDLVYCYLHYDHLTIETSESLTLFSVLNITVVEPTGCDIPLPQIDRDSKYYETLQHMFRPIRYVSCGLLGDFIHQLSIVNENYHKTGRKGDVYISEHHEKFRFGIEKAFNDLQPVLSMLYYINSFGIYNGEYIEYDLGSWRNNQLLYKTHFYNIFNNEYDIPFGKHKWLTAKCRRLDFVDKTVISTSMNRWKEDYASLISHIDVSNSVFIAFDNDSYNYFVNRTNIIIPLYICTTITEMIDIIDSCALFVGNLSSPLTLAYSLHKKSYVLPAQHDVNHHNGLESYMPFITILDI